MSSQESEQSIMEAKNILQSQTIYFNEVERNIFHEHSTRNKNK